MGDANSSLEGAIGAPDPCGQCFTMAKLCVLSKKCYKQDETFWRECPRKMKIKNRKVESSETPVCPYPRSTHTVEQRIAWLASCKSCCCRRFSRLVPHSNDQHRRLAIVVRRRRLVAGPAALRRGEGRQSTVLEGQRQGRGRRRGFRVRGWTS